MKLHLKKANNTHKSMTISRIRLGCVIKANCPHVGPWPVEELTKWGDFLWDPSPYLREF